MQTKERETRRENLRRIRRDLLRPLRVVEVLDCSAVFAKCPTEIKEASVISDRDTGELFLTVLFRCLSVKSPESLDICVLLYEENVCVPYAKIPFRYGNTEGTFGERIYKGCVRTKKECKAEPLPVYGELFGQGVYLPLPDSYFHRLQIKLLDVVYKDGTKETLDLIANTEALRFEELDDALQTTYSHINAFEREEQQHPIRVLPTVGENAWLCCCGQKNPAKGSRCERCGRDKEWQMANLTPQRLQEEQQKLEESRSVRFLHDKSAFPQNRYLETTDERKKKEKAFMAFQEKQKRRQRHREKFRKNIRRSIRWGVGLLALFSLSAFLGFVIYMVIQAYQANLA